MVISYNCREGYLLGQRLFSIKQQRRWYSHCKQEYHFNQYEHRTIYKVQRKENFCARNLGTKFKEICITLVRIDIWLQEIETRRFNTCRLLDFYTFIDHVSP